MDFTNPFQLPLKRIYLLPQKSMPKNWPPRRGFPKIIPGKLPKNHQLKKVPFQKVPLKSF